MPAMNQCAQQTLEQAWKRDAAAGRADADAVLAAVASLPGGADIVRRLGVALSGVSADAASGAYAMAFNARTRRVRGA